MTSRSRRLLLFASSLSTVLAQSPVAFANVVGADTQNFNATPDGLDFVTVESSEVLRSGVFNLGLFLNYAANTLPEFPEDGAAADPKGKLQDRLLGADFNFAVGLFRNFQFGLSLPHTLSQSIVNATDNQRGQFAKPGTTEIRPSLKFRFFGEKNLRSTHPAARPKIPGSRRFSFRHWPKWSRLRLSRLLSLQILRSCLSCSLLSVDLTVPTNRL